MATFAFHIEPANRSAICCFGSGGLSNGFTGSWTLSRFSVRITKAKTRAARLNTMAMITISIENLLPEDFGSSRYLWARVPIFAFEGARSINRLVAPHNPVCSRHACEDDAVLRKQPASHEVNAKRIGIGLG
jgi:hypothetical protein